MNFENLKPLPHCLCEIDSEGKIYELHDDSDFHGIIYTITNNEIFLIWKYPSLWFQSQAIRGNDYIDKHNINLKKPCFISLCFKNVNYLSISGFDDDFIIENHNCLFEISENFVEGEKGLLFSFGSGMEIAIQSDSVSFIYDYKI